MPWLTRYFIPLKQLFPNAAWLWQYLTQNVRHDNPPGSCLRHSWSIMCLQNGWLDISEEVNNVFERKGWPRSDCSDEGEASLCGRFRAEDRTCQCTHYRQANMANISAQLLSKTARCSSACDFSQNICPGKFSQMPLGTGALRSHQTEGAHTSLR